MLWLSLLTMSAAVRNIRQETSLLVILRARQFTHVTVALTETLPPPKRHMSPSTISQQLLLPPASSTSLTDVYTRGTVICTPSRRQLHAWVDV